MDVADVVATGLFAILPNRLQKREDFDVADGSADLGDHHVDVLGRHATNATLDLVGDVRDHLNGLTQVITTTFRGQNRLIDRSRGGIRIAREVLVDETFVVTEIEIGFTAVIGDEHFAVFEGIHGARVDVDVRIELLHGHTQTTQFEETTERRSGETLTERTRDPSGHEDVLRHVNLPFPDARSSTYNGRSPYLARDSSPAIPHEFQPAKSSRACRRAAALSGRPDNIRAISSIRGLPATDSTVARV